MISNSMQANESPRATLRAADGKVIVRMEDRFRTDINDLWSAITNPERLARWIARVDGDLRLGAVVQASFTSGWEGPVRVDVCEPPRRLQLDMAPGEGESWVLTAELTTDGDFSYLVVEEHGVPLEDSPYHAAGWQAHFEDLTAYLAGQPSDGWETRWNELLPVYRQQGHPLR